MAAVTPKVHYFGIHARAEFVKIILEDKGVKYDFVAYNFGEHKTKNADLFTFGQVPAYEEGDLVLVQTPTICRYLAKKHGLYPSDAKEAARAEVVEDGVFDLYNKVSQSLFRGNPSKEELVSTVLPTWLGYFEKILKKSGSGWATKEFTFADLLLFQVVDFVEKNFPGSLEKFPLLSAHRGKVAARPNVAAYLKSERRPEVECGK